MTQEEKAKAYDEALKRAKAVWRFSSNSAEIMRMEEIFPELKESEDEKIRRTITSIILSEKRQQFHIDGINGILYDDMVAWLEKQGSEQKPILDFKASNFYVSKVDGKIHDITYNPADKVEPFDKYEGLTDFERTLADICIGWIGEELGWKQYIKDNADVLLKIAIKMFNSIQDAPFEQKPAWSDEDEEKLQDCIGAIWAADYYLYEDKQEMEVWLKSIKDRIGG